MLCPATLVASITAIAVAIAEGKSSDEVGALGAIFTQLGDTLTTIATQQDLMDSQKTTHSEQ